MVQLGKWFNGGMFIVHTVLRYYGTFSSTTIIVWMGEGRNVANNYHRAFNIRKVLDLSRLPRNV